tara:strand:+ start:118 stop:315 length:198 start_codon:yes stop_codon:yes gene_type:complete
MTKDEFKEYKCGVYWLRLEVDGETDWVIGKLRQSRIMEYNNKPMSPALISEIQGPIGTLSQFRLK